MTLETVVLSVAGRPLAHTRCTLQASAEKAVRSGSFDVAWNGPGLPCDIDEECTVTVGATLWLTGYVSNVNWAHDENTRTNTVAVVSRTVDATEASIDHPTGYAEDVDLAGIAETFDTAGIGVEVKVKSQKKALHQIVPGETLFDTLERDTRAIGALIHDTPQGKLVIVDKPEGRHAGGLLYGVNVIKASGTLSGRFNYSEVLVRGQASLGTGGPSLRPQGKARGQSDRKRPLIIYHEGETTSERVKKRAGWEAKRADGQAKQASVTVPGWRDGGGLLWTPNFLVSVVDPLGALEQDMVIASVSLTQVAAGGGGDGGTTATLTLKDPRALGGENPRGKSGAGWQAPDSDPSFMVG